MKRFISRRWRHEHRRALRTIGRRRRLRLLVAGIATTAAAASGAFRQSSPFGTEQVGQTYANGILLPSNQWIKPIGTRLLVNNGRVLSSAISPNGEFLAALHLERLHRLPDHRQPEDRQDRPAGRHRRGRGQDDRRRHGGAPTGRCGRPTARRCGCRRPPTCSGSASAADRHGQAGHHDHPGDGDGQPDHGQHHGARPALGHGAQPRRVQALRRAQRREQARRHRHHDERADPDRSGSATRRARWCWSATTPSSPTRAAARPRRMTSPTTPTARTSSPARSPAPPSPARCPRWT